LISCLTQYRREKIDLSLERAPSLDKIPFSVYDFFAYLSSGTILLATADYVMGLGLLQQDKVGPVFAVFLVVLAYVCGHIVAHFSSGLLEHVALGRILKRPNALLLGEAPRRGFVWVFRNYCRPLPTATVERIKKQLESRGVSAMGEAAFLHAYALVTANTERQQRLDSFRNQYGFHRNMCFAFGVSAVAIAVAHLIGHHPVRWRWSILSAAVSVTLFYRYLKFFRQYSYELFLRYAEWPPSGTQKE
jgi:hypothetical protein